MYSQQLIRQYSFDFVSRLFYKALAFISHYKG
jgi:hypothetical protein